MDSRIGNSRRDADETEGTLASDPRVPGPLADRMRSGNKWPSVRFRDTEMTGGNRYEVYTAATREEAIGFLRDQDVREEKRYIIVETAQGCFGRDLIAIFDEENQATIEYGERRPLPEPVPSMTRCARCGHTVLPAGRHSGATELITVEQLKAKGIGFVCSECVTLWCPFCITLLEKQPLCGLCERPVVLYRES